MNCRLCRDTHFVVLPQPDAVWDALSGFIAGVGVTISCPDCIGSSAELTKGQLDYLACWREIRGLPSSYRQRTGELRPILRKIIGAVTVAARPGGEAGEEDIQATVAVVAGGSGKAAIDDSEWDVEET